VATARQPTTDAASWPTTSPEARREHPTSRGKSKSRYRSGGRTARLALRAWKTRFSAGSIQAPGPRTRAPQSVSHSTFRILNSIGEPRNARVPQTHTHPRGALSLRRTHGSSCASCMEDTLLSVERLQISGCDLLVGRGGPKTAPSGSPDGLRAASHELGDLMGALLQVAG